MTKHDERAFAIQILGAAQTVTGSMHLLQAGPYRILVDCGLFQGRRAESRHRNRMLPRAATEADVCLLTHAHIDHSGNIPSLVKRGFSGKVHCTDATADLCQAMLRDAARIQVSDAKWLNRRNQDDPTWEPIEALYNEDDAIKALDRFMPHEYNEPFELFPGIHVTYIDAGHILGSASIVIDVKLNGHRRRVVFSGDIGRRNLPILRDPTPPEHADYIVMESTYGNRTHAPVERMDDQLLEAIAPTLVNKGKVIIPSFALERTQEIVFALNRLIKAGRLQPVPVFVDSPLAVNVTQIFRRHEDCYDKEALHFDHNHGDPFGFDVLKMVETVEASKRLNETPGPMIIISASGMCEAGRVLHHLRNNIENSNNAVVIVGFQAPHTLGRRIVERRPRVRIFGVERDLHAKVSVLNAFSAHADRDELLWWAKACGPQVRHFYLVHGDPEPCEALRDALASEGRKATIPSQGQSFPLEY